LTSKEDVAPADHALFDELAALRGRLSGPASVVFHSPALSKPWNDQSEFLHREASIEPKYAELAVVAGAREKDCRYIFSAHSKAARKGGTSEAALTAARDNASLDGLDPKEAAVIAYVRQLMRNNRVDQPTFDAMLSAHGPQKLVELTGFMSRYAALAGVLNAFEVPAGPDADPLPIPMPNAAPRGRVAPPRATPRVPQLTQRDQVAEDKRAFFDSVASSRGTVRGPYSLLMHSPKWALLVSEVSRYLRKRSLLNNTPDCELCTIAVAREKDCPYVWAAHVPAARKAGASEQAIAAIRDRKDLAGLKQEEADIIDYTRQLSRTHHITQPLFDRLQKRHGTPWLVELTALIGHYGMITAQINAFELAPKPDAEQLPL